MPAAGGRRRAVWLLSRGRGACHAALVGRPVRDSAEELRAVAALVVGGELVGPCTLVTSGAQTIGFSSAELLRAAGQPLEIALTFDGARRLPVASWMIGHGGIGLVELGAPVPAGERLDVVALPLGAVFASLETRGAPAGLVTIEGRAKGWSRRVVPVHVDAVDGGAGPGAAWSADEVLAQLATPVDPADARVPVAGAPLFAWLPPDPVLGRRSEVVVVALGLPERTPAFQPRGAPPIAQLVGLEDLGRALSWAAGEAGNELAQVAGEIRDVPSGPTGIGGKR